MSADDLKAKAIGALRRLQKLPGIVRGFLRDPKLAYILELRQETVREVYKLIFSLVRGLSHLKLQSRNSPSIPVESHIHRIRLWRGWGWSEKSGLWV